ncbi:carbohydrate sulfotransferase 3-like [Bolinopsis microptera]|uniref:carbohydrate sulfotransferase 3-like n=1 Tax=Bolinopsis microptera TaxID=2820187 RepID=UPI00307A78EE
MNFRRIFRWIFVIILIHMAVLACFFREYILSLSSTSISISDNVSGNGDHQAIIEELEKMWQEKLIEDLFHDITVAPNILHKEMKHENWQESEENAEKDNKSEVEAAKNKADGFQIDESEYNPDENLKEGKFDDHQEIILTKLKDDQNAGALDNSAELQKPPVVTLKPLVSIQVQDAKDTEHVTSLPKQPKMVLLLTQSRHGSTWLMNMLGYRDEAVPVFEPLNDDKFLKMYTFSEEANEMTFPEGYKLVNYKDWREVYLARICICDWHGNKIPEKNYFGSIRGLWYKKKIENPAVKNTKAAEALCFEEGSMMVPKTIRYYNMSTLFRIKDFGCESFKVIHLVRDPRAVMNSRMGVFHELFDGNKNLGAHIESKKGQAGFDEAYMARAADWMCSHHLYNYKLGMNPPPWLKGRYKMVRYEDLAEFPSQLTSEILHFIGVNYTSKYKEYVYNLTHAKDLGKKEGSTYGIEKQSSEIIDRWKKKLIEPHWRTIETVCADMMKAFNYEPTFFNIKD